MEGLLENKALAYSILFSGGSILALTVGLLPEMSTKFELIDLPPEVSETRRIDFCFLLRSSLF